MAKSIRLFQTTILKVTSETGYAQLGFKTTEKQQNNQYMKVYREAMNPGSRSACEQKLRMKTDVKR